MKQVGSPVLAGGLKQSGSKSEAKPNPVPVPVPEPELLLGLSSGLVKTESEVTVTYGVSDSVISR